MIALVASACLTACATASPPKHSERLQKAAGVKTFQIDTTKELWEKTSEQTPYDAREREIKAKKKNLPNGLVRIELDGVSLGNYLRLLDHDAHGGVDSPWNRNYEAESVRMYDEISAVLDGITARPDPKEPPPRIVVDTAFIGKKRDRPNDDPPPTGQ